MSNSWINKYRPQTFDEVIGQGTAVRSLQGAIAKKNSNAFLFTGPSGVGKTTLARITANELDIQPANLLEIDAATNTGIDAMRAVTEELAYKPLGGGTKGIIVDEAHALSKPAIQSLLKILEEPPEWVYWFLCTTEESRILSTVKTRCLRVALTPVPKQKLLALLQDVAKEERIKFPSGVVELCAQEAQGSPRLSLAFLSACTTAEDLEDARKIIGAATGSVEAVELARVLVKGTQWADAFDLLKKLKDNDPESVRRVLQAYFASVIVNADTKDIAGRMLERSQHFNQPFYTYGNLVQAVGEAMLS